LYNGERLSEELGKTEVVVMKNLKYPLVELENNKFQVSVDLNLYAKEVITTTLYKFIHLYFVHQETDTCNPNIIQVVFESKENNIINAEVPRQFCNELIDQQIRYNTNIQFGHIRDLIVEEAFRPINVKR
jgi:His-Xaa-Ser system protein HxsD